ncbi:MAG TPA: ribonuclease HI [Bacteroidales bacterium]|nr:ribonuclease HI [Bacteroidales bacterium]HQL69279.1 ribonuclease HI [Bacteroidales bacterium]
MPTTETPILIYTDGSASGNPGPGGYAAILKSGSHTKEISGGFRMTTNNRMELLAVIKALKCLKKPGSQVLVFSDSKYVVDAVEKKWVFDWEQKNFKNKKNEDLWREFLNIYRKHNVRFEWVKGHSTNEFNNRCDQLAVLAGKNDCSNIDSEYENLNQTPGL